jgi:hypothetical protein
MVWQLPSKNTHKSLNQIHHIALEPSTRELEQGVFATLERDMDDTRMHTQRDNPVHVMKDGFN